MSVKHGVNAPSCPLKSSLTSLVMQTIALETRFLLRCMGCALHIQQSAACMPEIVEVSAALTVGRRMSQ